MIFVDYDYFLRWHQLLCQTQAHSDTIREVFLLKHKLSKNLTLSVIKRFSRSLIHILICFWSLGIKYLHDMNISSQGLRKETWWIRNAIENPVCVYLGSEFVYIRLTIDLNSALNSIDRKRDDFLESLIMYSCSKCLAHPSRWIAGLSVWILSSFCHS